MYRIKKEPSETPTILTRLFLLPLPPDFPEHPYFEAESIKDFLENKQEIAEATAVPIRFRSRYGLSDQLAAIVGVGAVYYRHLDVSDRYHHLYTRTGEISDFGSFHDPEKSLEVIIKDSEVPIVISRKKRELLRDGMRLDNCTVAYLPYSPTMRWEFHKPHDPGGYLWLVHYENRDPTASDRIKEGKKGHSGPVQWVPSPI